MKIFNLDELKERVQKDLQFTEFNIIDENRNNLAKQHHYLSIFLEEQEKLSTLEEKKNLLYTKLFNFYKWGKSDIYPNRQFDRHVTTQEIKEVYIPGDEKWLQLMKIYNKQKAIVNYLDKVVGMFEKRSYSLSNAVKLMQREGDI